MSMEGSSDKKGILFMPAAVATMECIEGNKVLWYKLRMVAENVFKTYVLEFPF